MSIEHLNTRRLEQIGHSAAAGRLSPIDTFQRTCDLMMVIQNGHIERFQELAESYQQTLQKMKEAADIMVELAEIVKMQKTEIKELRTFLKKTGMKKEYERRQYKRQMNAVYRRARKEMVK